MKYLILGSEGQLAKEFENVFTDTGAEFVSPKESDLDITDGARLESVIQESKPNVIINCAAYNQVDQAEKEPEIAAKVNVASVQTIAELCKKHGAFLVHYSSDYVFDGKKGALYTEEDAPKPLNVYGGTKLKGEEAVKAILTDYLIFRVSWVFGPFGKQNFLHKFSQWLKENPVIKVSADETSVPTYTGDIVDVTIASLDKGLKGLYHAPNSGYASRYEFARYFANATEVDNLIIPVPMKEFKTDAKRPSFAAMSNARISKELDISIPSWQYGVDRYVEAVGVV